MSHALLGMLLIGLAMTGLAGSGCSDDDDGGGTDSDTDADTDTDTDADTDSDTDTDTDTDETATVTGTVYGNNYPGNPEPIPLEGAEVCVHGYDELPCDVTDPDGEFVLTDVPTDGMLGFNMSHDDYVNHVAWWNILGGFDIMEALYKPGQVEDFNEAAGQTMEAGTGIFIVWANDSAADENLAGFTATLDPASGWTGYTDEIYMVDTDLTETSASGLVVFGNVDPGAVTVTGTHPDLVCDTNYPTGSDEIPVEAMADTITSVVFNCAE